MSYYTVQSKQTKFLRSVNNVHTLCGVQISKLYYISIDLSFDQNLITAVLYMALHVVLYRCWILHCRKCV